MFYSQTFLARKGPLGTVWCAAHLQHRLKKSHYTSTDISSTVDRIMFPEVPIALRMSGHLLLGVVRIYSKKVDYLLHDCNVTLIWLRKAFTTIDINLPEDATTARFESVTLPQTFDLDALDIGDDIFADGSPDNHMRSQEDITLTDQVPVGGDPYVAITFDEDIFMDTLPPEQVLDSRVRPMEEEDILPPLPVDGDVDFQDAGPSDQTEALAEKMGIQDPVPSNQTEVFPENMDCQDPGPSNQTEVHADNKEFQDPGPSNQTKVLTYMPDLQDPGSSNQTEILNRALGDGNSPPEIEVMRDAGYGFTSVLDPAHQNDKTEPNESPDRVLNEKETISPIGEDDLLSGAQSLPFQQRSEPPTSAASQEDHEIFDTYVSVGLKSPGLALLPTPPARQPQPRRRKRKQFFDESTVLTNRFMKKALHDYSDLLRRKGNIPSTALGIWKLKNTIGKEQVFYEPSITGLSSNISSLFKMDCISTKPHLTLGEEDIPQLRVVTSLAPGTEAITEAGNVSSAPTTETIPEPRNASSPAPANEAAPEPRNASSPVPSNEPVPEPAVARLPTLETENDEEIEHLRDDKGHAGNDFWSELLPSPVRVMPSLERSAPSPFREDGLTPISGSSLGLETTTHRVTTAGTGALPTPDYAVSAGTYGSGLETPRTLLEEQLAGDNTGLSDIPELVNSADAEDLHFLEADSTLVGSRSDQGIDSLSIRTRAVAQYLKTHSPIGQTSEDPSGDLSLNKILQGKTRKLCARMFFETLVLKSYGLVDVQQQQPYADITLKLTSDLLKAQI